MLLGLLSSTNALNCNVLTLKLGLFTYAAIMHISIEAGGGGGGGNVNQTQEMPGQTSGLNVKRHYQ